MCGAQALILAPAPEIVNAPTCDWLVAICYIPLLCVHTAQSKLTDPNNVRLRLSAQRFYFDKLDGRHVVIMETPKNEESMVQVQRLNATSAESRGNGTTAIAAWSGDADGGGGDGDSTGRAYECWIPRHRLEELPEQFSKT